MDFFDILLAKKLEDDRDPKVEGLSVTANGTYSEDGVVYKPVVVNVPETPLATLNATENRTYTAPAGTGYNEVNVNVPLPSNAYLLKELSNLPQPIASFSDGAENLPLKSLTASIEPQQDLHGYDSPWAGGSGRNLFNMGSKWSGSASGLSFTTDDDYVTMNGTKSGANYVTPSQLYFDLPAGTYYAKAFVISGTTSNAPSIYVYSNQELTSNMLNTERSFTIESQTSVGIRFAFWNDGATYSNYKIGIVISKTANIDKFYPYSNICPISGWTEEVVYKRGINQWDEQWESGGLDPSTGQTTSDSNRIRSKNTIEVKPSTSYYAYVGGMSSNDFRIYYYDANKDFISVGSWQYSDTFTTPSNCYYIKFVRVNTNTYNNDISINYPSTDTTYHAYAGTTTTIPFVDSQGNPVEVYGGSVDVISGGEQPRTFAMVDLGTLTWNKYTNSVKTYFRTNEQLSDAKKSDSPVTTHGLMCSHYTEDSWTHVVDSSGYDGDICIGWNNNAFIAIYDSRYNDLTAEEFKTAMSGVQLRYELATPTTFYTQPTSIKSLDGENNVFASTGDVEELKYFARATS